MGHYQQGQSDAVISPGKPTQEARRLSRISVSTPATGMKKIPMVNAPRTTMGTIARGCLDVVVGAFD